MKHFRVLLSLLFLVLVTACGESGNKSDPEPMDNQPPTVDAGEDQQLGSGQTAVLDGTADDSDGSIASIQWSQNSGSTVSLTSTDQLMASFVAPQVLSEETLTFTLTVTDDEGAVASDQVAVVISPISTSLLPAVGPDEAQCPATLADLGTTVVHVCDCQTGADSGCLAGNDANSGTANAPLQTLSAALSAFNAGSDVAFCRGGAWQTSSSLYPDLSSCSVESPCVFSDYGDGSLPKPLIALTSQYEAGINIDPASDAVQWSGFEINNLHLSKTTFHDQGSGIFMYRNINDVSMNCLEIEGFGIGVYIHNNDLVTQNVTLRDSVIHDNGVFGWLGGSNSALLERNHFDNNGYHNASSFQHNMYFSSISNDSVIRNNHLTGSALDASGSCQGPSLIVHSGQTQNLLIENNLIEETNPSGGCWGLNVDGVGNGEIHQNAIIRGNVVRNVGNQSIGIASCVDCIVENNLVIQTKFAGSTGIAVPNRPTSAPDADNTGTILRNNTVYFADAGSGIAYYVGERGSNYVVTNNIGYHANPILMNSDSCFNFDLSASAYDTVNSNLCFGAPFDIGTTGLDGMALTSDPLFVDAPNDFHLQASSPARDSGTSVSASQNDILDNLRDASPDRGAFEYTGN